MTTQSIKNFNRLEMKYLLTLEQKKLFLEALNLELIPDSHGKKWGNYELESVYYDTDDFKFFHEKLNGQEYRKKLRIRRYVREWEDFDDNSKVFIEIKEKAWEITLKRRVEMTYQEAKDFIEKRIIPVYKDEDNAVINEILELATEHTLKPRIITSYSRQAFFGKNKESGLRVTFDTQVDYQSSHLTLNNHEEKDGKIVSDNTTIMEVKANNEFPQFVTDFLDFHNILPQRISKYCQALERTDKELAKTSRQIRSERMIHKQTLISQN